MKMSNIFPILQWLPNYKKNDLGGDLSAGLTVGVMLIPQGMAYSMLAGLPPIYGLYASTSPLLIYAIFGTSRQLSVGPVAMASLLVASGLSVITTFEKNPETYIQLAILLAFLVGIIRFLMGVLKLGFLVNFLSRPVINGYTSAAALIIGLSQLKHLMGVKIPNSNYVHEVLYNAALNIQYTHFLTLSIGIGGIILLLALKQIKKNYKINIPGPLAIVFISTILVWGLGLFNNGVAIVSEVPKGFPSPILPQLSLELIQTLLPASLTIAIVGYMESIAVAKAIQEKHKTYKVSANQELVALGLANIVGAFFQAFPVNGGFSRTAVNDQAGARTPLASMFSAILVILTLLFLTPLFYYLPKAVLASIVMVAVFNLIDVEEAKKLWKTNRQDFWMLIIAFGSTLFIGIVQGILIGIILSLILLVYKSSNPHIAFLGKVPNTTSYRNLSRFKNLEDRPDILIIRFDAELYFANAEFFAENLLSSVQSKNPNLKALILDAGSISGIDSTGMNIIEDININLTKQGIRWYWCEVRGPVRDQMSKSGIIDQIGKDNFFVCIQDAVDDFDGQKIEHTKPYALQRN